MRLPALLLSTLFIACSPAGNTTDDGGAPDGGGTSNGGPGRVDPFIATGGSGFNVGSAFPGAVAPNGLVAPSPDTIGSLWGDVRFLHCSGYWYGDETIQGFSNLHMHGTGIPDYGVLTLMPIPTFDAGKIRKEGYQSDYKKASERAEPGYYAVTLDNGGIRVELTATTRAAYHRYTFAPGATTGHVVIDHGLVQAGVEERAIGADGGGVFGTREDIERLRGPIAARALFATDEDVEAVDLGAVELAHGGGEGDVLGLGVAAVFEAAGDGDVELARQVGELAIADDDLVELADDRRGVEELVLTEAGDGAATDAADVVQTGLLAAQADVFEAAEDVGDVGEGEPAELDLLAGGEVAEALAVLVGEVGDDPQLLRAGLPGFQAQAQHEVPGRRLAEEEAVPFGALLVVLAHVEPAVAIRQSHDVGEAVEAVLLVLDFLDLVLGGGGGGVAVGGEQLGEEGLTGAATRAGAMDGSVRRATWSIISG